MANSKKRNLLIIGMYDKVFILKQSCKCQKWRLWVWKCTTLQDCLNCLWVEPRQQPREQGVQNCCPRRPPPRRWVSQDGRPLEYTMYDMISHTLCKHRLVRAYINQLDPIYWMYCRCNWSGSPTPSSWGPRRWRRRCPWCWPGSSPIVPSLFILNCHPRVSQLSS